MWHEIVWTNTGPHKPPQLASARVG